MVAAVRVAAPQKNHTAVLNYHDLVLLAVRLVSARHLELQSAVSLSIMTVWLLKWHEHGCLARNLAEG